MNPRTPMKFLVTLLFMAFVISMNSASVKSFDFEFVSEETIEFNKIYKVLKAKSIARLPDITVIKKAIKGYKKLEETGKIQNQRLTIIDFRKSSREKRMWVIDMASMEVVYHTHVSHGKNSGNEFATKFSNRVHSNQSSLGFYLTDHTYEGKHGKSLRIDGLESGFNSNARDRAVVIHGASYANPSLIGEDGRLGRSYGCPALPWSNAFDIIDEIKDKSCLFIYYPDKDYLEKSTFLNS